MGQSPVWRPHPGIRAKAVAIVRHENRLLVCEVLDDKSTVKGWCPLGGGVEFGETAENALKREIREELGCDIIVLGAPTVCENIFEHGGVKGHEIVFAFPVSLNDPQIYLTQRFQIREDNGSLHYVEWVDVQRFRDGAAVLFPNAISDQLIAD